MTSSFCVDEVSATALVPAAEPDDAEALAVEVAVLLLPLDESDDELSDSEVPVEVPLDETEEPEEAIWEAWLADTLVVTEESSALLVEVVRTSWPIASGEISMKAMVGPATVEELERTTTSARIG